MFIVCSKTETVGTSWNRLSTNMTLNCKLPTIADPKTAATVILCLVSNIADKAASNYF